MLREVVAQGSFSEAASALYYTQSAVSQAIATLEAEAGVPLIERDRARGTPDRAGGGSAEHAGRILTQLDVAEAELGAIAGVSGGELRMASFPTAGRDPDAAGDRRPSGRRTPASPSAWPRASRRRSLRGCATASSTSA